MSTDTTRQHGNDASTPSEPPHPEQQHHAGRHPAEHPTAPLPPQPRYGQYAPGQTAQQPPSHVPPAHAPSDPYAVPLGTVSGPGGPGAPGGPGGTGHDPRDRRPRGWAPVLGAAAVAALLASGGTAALVGALDGDASAALTDLGATPRETDSAPVASSTDQVPDWEAVTSAVAPSVVAIQVAGQQGGSQGSGVILDEDGRIVTNNHVVAPAANGGELQVTLSDGRLYEAEIVGLDPTTDLAVVQIVDPPEDLVAASFGDSESVRVGDSVLAVGNPLGLAHTATTGIVSALDRPVSAQGEEGGERVVTNAIQIDAAINPGNSGGPLFNAQGQVIGITSSIATLSSGMGGQSGSIGLGFAIPVNLARNIADQLVEDGAAEHAFLGVSLEDTTATADGVTRRGAGVVEVTAGSPAAEAGLQAGDVVVALDDQPVNGAESLTASVRERTAGEQATVTFVRDGQTETADVTFAVREESTSQQPGSGQESPEGSQEEGSDPTLPDNVPGWLEDLFGQQG